jgi:hypothetical protein
VHKGDYVDYNDWGGNEWHWGPFDGIPYQVFSRVPGSTTNFYSQNDGTNVGSQWKPAQSKQGEELLMQTKLATGPDATDICPGGYQQHIFKGVDVKTPQIGTVRTRLRYVKVRTLCPGPSYGHCTGNMTLEATLGGQKTTLGSTPFKIEPNTTPSVQIPLSKLAVKLIQKAKVVSARVTAEGHDSPDTDPRANAGVPTQHKTTSATITLRPDKTLSQTRHKKKKHRKRR